MNLLIKLQRPECGVEVSGGGCGGGEGEGEVAPEVGGREVGRELWVSEESGCSTEIVESA